MAVALSGEDFQQWRGHIDYAIAERGQWLGLVDEDWQPICDMPAVLELQAVQQRLAAADIQVSIPASYDGVPHMVVDELIANELGVFSEDGRLEPNNLVARSVVVQREGPRSRQAFFITHATAEGDGTVPTVLRIYGQDLLGLLAATPCPSVPRTWNSGVREWTEDAGGQYRTARVYGAVEMADVADGYTVAGAAVPTIKTLIQDSVDAVCSQLSWPDRHIFVDFSTPDESPEVVIRVTDQSVWEAVAEPARLAGVTVSAFLWWPGDDPIIARINRDDDPEDYSPDYPCCVVRVETSKEI